MGSVVHSGFEWGRSVDDDRGAVRLTTTPLYVPYYCAQDEGQNVVCFTTRIVEPTTKHRGQRALSFGIGGIRLHIWFSRSNELKVYDGKRKLRCSAGIPSGEWVKVKIYFRENPWRIVTTLEPQSSQVMGTDAPDTPEVPR
jgi:hypothetical protein